jgi:hypothetical protein
MRHPVLITALASMAIGVGAALADDDCDAPVVDWQPRSAVEKLADSKGWTPRRIKVDDGCYEIKGRNAAGKEIEAKIHPVTLEIVEIEIEDDHDDDDDERGKHDARAPYRSAPDGPEVAPGNQAPRNPLLNGGSRPTVIVQ